MSPIAMSRRMVLALLLSLAAGESFARAAMAIEGDWVGEDDMRRTVRLTIAQGKLVFFAATGDNQPDGLERAAPRIRRVKFSRDGRGVEFTFDGGRAMARLEGQFIRGAIWDSLGKTAFAVGLI